MKASPYLPNKSSRPSAALAFVVFGVLLGAAWAQTETVLYNFCAQSGCTDGQQASSAPVFDRQGNLYGMTFSGGANFNSCDNSGCGVVFKLTTEGKETVLHSFCSKNNCSDGSNPAAPALLDRKGNLYGTTYYGGAYGGGVVFKVTPEGKETVLHSFDGADGWLPSGMAFDQEGSLHGLASEGGAYGDGVVFRVTAEGKGTVLYNFCAKSGCADGKNPFGAPVLDREGNLYGTTVVGGAHSSGYCSDVAEGCGVVFKLTPEGRETVLYSFCARGGYKCSDGAVPEAGLVFDRKGNIYGTTAYGGAHDGGTVFKLTPEGKETVLYSFCAQGGENCTDGAIPSSGVIFDQMGNMYGTTANGGAYGYYCGVVFKVTPKGKETVLHNFCAQYGATDGAQPLAGLVFGPDGDLYGTTFNGGAYNNFQGQGGGVVFRLTP